MNRSKRGITIIEFLVIVVVGVLLAMILMPVYASNGRSTRTICLSLVKQQALCVLIYANDYDSIAPGAGKWMDETTPYTRDSGIYRCPDMAPDQHYGYAFRTSDSRINLAKVKAPEKRILTFDSPDLGRNANTEQTAFPNLKRHQKQSVSYLDGHAHSREWMTSEAP
jgi:hypothetical protein